jgi:hypothetical protein
MTGYFDKLALSIDEMLGATAGFRGRPYGDRGDPAQSLCGGGSGLEFAGGTIADVNE